MDGVPGAFGGRVAVRWEDECDGVRFGWGDEEEEAQWEESGEGGEEHGSREGALPWSMKLLRCR